MNMWFDTLLPILAVLSVNYVVVNIIASIHAEMFRKNVQIPQKGFHYTWSLLRSLVIILPACSHLHTTIWLSVMALGFHAFRYDEALISFRRIDLKMDVSWIDMILYRWFGDRARAAMRIAGIILIVTGIWMYVHLS